jgi:hypothetical protein
VRHKDFRSCMLETFDITGDFIGRRTHLPTRYGMAHPECS